MYNLITIKDGTLIIPEDFIPLPEAETEEKAYAGIMEPQNQASGLPHFVVFSSHPIPEMSEDEQDLAIALCREYVRARLGIENRDEWYIFGVREIDDLTELYHGTGILRKKGYRYGEELF